MPTEMPEHEREAADASTEVAADAAEVVPEQVSVEPSQVESDSEEPVEVENEDESSDEGAGGAEAPESPQSVQETSAPGDPEPLESSDATEPEPDSEQSQPAAKADADVDEAGKPAGEAVAPAEPGARRAALADARSRRRMLVWPFVVYALLWVAFIALMVWQLVSLPDGAIAYNASVYAWTVWGGVALVALAPVTVLVAWLLARRPGADANEGVLSVALLRGSIVALAGVVIWWIALSAVDYVRLGRLF